MTSLIQPVSCRRARFFRYYHSIARRPLILTLHEPPLRPPPRSRPRPRSALVSRTRTRTRTRTIGFMVPTRDCEVLGALHEPPPHPFPLPIRWGEGGRRPGEGRFMVPMHAEKRKGAFHEPYPRSGVSAERRWLLFPRIAALCRDAATPKFMAPTHVQLFGGVPSP